MEKCCADGFAPECANCKYWTKIGCKYPFHIYLCPAYKRAEMKRKAEDAAILLEEEIK